jgi:hypothetical protein
MMIVRTGIFPVACSVVCRSRHPVDGKAGRPITQRDLIKFEILELRSEFQ